MSGPLTEPAFIAIGSNIEPERYLPLSISHLSGLGQLVAVSRAYESKPVGGRDQPGFLNAAALIDVSVQPDAIRLSLRKIEADLGRARTEDKYASRTIDLDLVMLGDRIDREFPLPDPGILIHGHLAIPLAELAPDFCHPITGEALGSIGARLRSDDLRLNARVSQRLADLLLEG